MPIAGTPAASQDSFPTTILDMPVLTVAMAGEALAAGLLDGRFAAVGGYWRQYQLPCPYPAHKPDIEGYCAGGKFRDQAADTGLGGGVGGDDTPIAMPETLNDDLLWSNGSAAPARVVLIVHADDSRAKQCAPSTYINCHTHMVIDDVAFIDGTETPIGSSREDGVQARLTLSELAQIAVKPDEQLITAYALPATHLNDVDPRLMGEGAGVVWYVRVAHPAASGETTAGGAVRLVSDADASLIEELPLALGAGYDPARLVLDSKFGNNLADPRPQFELLIGSTLLADGVLNVGTPPLAVDAGTYALRALVNDAVGADRSSATCSLPVTIDAGANAAYKATFRGSSCSWAPFDETAS